jgi:nucleoside-diphosphate-sugar epimerase
MTRVVVTGGSGKAGRAVVDDLVASGYEVLNVDIARIRVMMHSS